MLVFLSFTYLCTLYNLMCPTYFFQDHRVILIKTSPSLFNYLVREGFKTNFTSFWLFKEINRCSKTKRGLRITRLFK